MLKKSHKLMIFVGFSVLLFFLLREYLTLEFIQTKQDVLKLFYQENKALGAMLYIITYVVLSTCGLPVPALLTLFSGFVLLKS